MDVTPAAHAAAFWTALNLILLLVLAVLVVRQRGIHRVALGDGGVPPLNQAIRAFGNATEYIPTALIGLGILAFAGAPPMVIHPLGLVLFAGRVLHAVGVSRSGGVSWWRTYGVLATWTAYVALAAALLFFAIP